MTIDGIAIATAMTVVKTIRATGVAEDVTTAIEWPRRARVNECERSTVPAS